MQTSELRGNFFESECWNFEHFQSKPYFYFYQLLLLFFHILKNSVLRLTQPINKLSSCHAACESVKLDQMCHLQFCRSVTWRLVFKREVTFWAISDRGTTRQRYYLSWWISKIITRNLWWSQRRIETLWAWKLKGKGTETVSCVSCHTHENGNKQKYFFLRISFLWHLIECITATFDIVFP